jgi:hypothetical protein
MSAMSTWPGGLMPAAFARVRLEGASAFRLEEEKLIADWLAWGLPWLLSSPPAHPTLASCARSGRPHPPLRGGGSSVQKSILLAPLKHLQLAQYFSKPVTVSSRVALSKLYFMH